MSLVMSGRGLSNSSKSLSTLWFGMKGWITQATIMIMLDWMATNDTKRAIITMIQQLEFDDTFLFSPLLQRLTSFSCPFFVVSTGAGEEQEPPSARIEIFFSRKAVLFTMPSSLL